MDSPSEIFSPSTLSISQCVTLKLTETNYLLWKTQFESFLSSQILLGYVNGDTPRPSPTTSVKTGDLVTESPNPDFVKWIRNDQIVLAWLFGSLSKEALRSVYGLHTSKEVWMTLAKKFNRVSATRKLDLQRRLYGLMKHGKSMAQYLSDAKAICDQLDSIGCSLTDQEKIYGLLHNLGQEYESITTYIENSMDSFPGPTFEDVGYRLTNFDDKLQGYTNSASAVTPHLTFSAERDYYSSGRGQGYGRSGSRGRGRGYSTRGRGFHQQINTQSSQSSSERPTCQICGKYGHSAAKCYKRFDHSYQMEGVHSAMAAMKVTDHSMPSGQEWYPDTGATAHITNSPAQLQNSQVYKGDDAVMVGNGDFLPITHIGSIAIPTLQEFGFICSYPDPSLFVYLRGNDTMLLLLYVDDMLLTGNNSKLMDQLLVSLSSIFRMKDLGPLHYFLGIQALFHDGGLFLNQEKYATDLLVTAGMADCAPMPTPLPLQPGKIAGQSKLFSNPTYFRSLAGKLQYLTLTRPDIQFAVNFVCQKMHSPSEDDFFLLKRILRYVKGTVRLGINLSNTTDSTLRVYSDSGWSGCKDTSRSTGGFCTFLGANIISWSSKRHPTVSHSSTESEYRTLSLASREIMWLNNLLRETGVAQPVTPKMYCDNLSVVHLTVNPALHSKMKHFARDFHHVREQVALGALIVEHIPAQDQLADIFTKSLPPAAFCDLRFKLGLCLPPTPSLREGNNSKVPLSHLM
ncbi:PREDICTED: uncharacterized protein LOC104774223 [Camelina sativa]|uniref:Uncharacterized protein LOC104770945 n=1 Tax=Camelina sativa TaxID=90675 RepID=A0ABM0Y0Q5_CAMSA|nr:PREDICTED: uncharacterized protein LOC104770945 [Camelina sativa]XP_010497182.1 PREDICTED: uncharacterized protein LOC104774223 [Camelina sativa]